MVYTLVSVPAPAVTVTLPGTPGQGEISLVCRAMGHREAMEYFRALQSEVDMVAGLVQAWNVQSADQELPLTAINIARLLDEDETERRASDFAVGYIKALDELRKGN